MNEMLIGLCFALYAWSMFLLVKLIHAKQKILELEMYLVAERSCKDEYLIGWTAASNRIGAAIKILDGGMEGRNK